MLATALRPSRAPHALELLGVECLNAEALVLDVILPLSQKLSDHLIDGLLDAALSNLS